MKIRELRGWQTETENQFEIGKDNTVELQHPT